MRHAGNQRREAALLLRLRAGERERAHGAAVEGAQERDHLLAAGMIAGQLEGALDGLGPGVAVEELVRAGHGRDGREPGGQIGDMFVVKIGAGDVNQLGGLFLNGGDNFRVAVAGGDHGDARREVEKFVAVRVFHANAAAALGNQWIGAGVAGRNQPLVGFDGGLGFGSGQRTDELGSELSMHFLLGHLLVSSTHSVVRPDGNGSNESRDAARPRTPCRWSRPVFPVQCVIHRDGREGQGSLFARQGLIAGEEARSSAGGQHAQVLPRTDDARARP